MTGEDERLDGEGERGSDEGGRLPGEGESRERQPQPRRRRQIARAVALVVALGLVFFAGLAVGRAIEDTPEPGGTQTIVRTLEPATVKPEPRTVTVFETPPRG